MITPKRNTHLIYIMQYKTQSHASIQIQYQPHTTQAHYQSEQISNQHLSSQTSINVETYCTLPYSTTLFTKPITTYSSTITSSQNNVSDNNINTRDKFQVYFSNQANQCKLQQIVV